jgi:hypothetical protein
MPYPYLTSVMQNGKLKRKLLSSRSVLPEIGRSKFANFAGSMVIIWSQVSKKGQPKTADPSKLVETAGTEPASGNALPSALHTCLVSFD